MSRLELHLDELNQRIAELEAEVEASRAEVERLRNRAKWNADRYQVGEFEQIARLSSDNFKLRAELATERAKRCDGCRYWEQPQHRDAVCGGHISVDYDDLPPPDFACNRWEAKEEK